LTGKDQVKISASPDTRKKDDFRGDIEGLRGVAVLLVVLYHAGLLCNAPFQIVGGFVGVDLFFVVSGFLITGLLIRERERSGSISFPAFYARRLRRILPAAVVVLLITIPLSYVLVTLVRRPDTMVDATAAALSVANIRFAITTDYFNPVNYSPFLHFWSLGVEEQFYLVWPALLFVATWRRLRLGAAAALALVIAVSFVVSVWATDQNPGWAFYMLPTRAWQLAAGGILAVGAGSLSKVREPIRGALSRALPVAGWVALAALAFEALTLDSRSVPYPGLAALVPTVAAVLLITSGPASCGPGLLFRLIPVRLLGKISYSLYLWHWPILILGGLWLGGSLEMGAAGAPVQLLTPPQAVGLALLAIPVAAASWRFVEEPFRRGRISLPRPTRMVAAGVAAMAIVAIVGTGLGFGAQNELASLGGGDVAAAVQTDAPTPDTAAATATASAAPVDPGSSPTPFATPAMTPALTLAPIETPNSFAVTNSLRPNLARAPVDYEQPWHVSCLAFARVTVPVPAGQCVYGNPNGSYTVALVGDSHASALFPAVNAMATAHGWKLLIFVKINCPFLDIPVYDPNARREYGECEIWNKNVVQRLNANPPDLIIVHNSRWVQIVRSSDDSVAAEGNAMAREMAKLPAASKLLMVQDIPDPQGHNVPDCLSKHLSDYRSCAYSRTIAYNFDMGAREAIAAKATGARLIDLTDAICPGTGSCPVVMNGMIMFRDDHHLTATFAQSLGPDLDARVVDALLADEASTPSPS
jgi:peptidoglycan/LPS O-acetylase OafA/YrhL